MVQKTTWRPWKFRWRLLFSCILVNSILLLVLAVFKAIDPTPFLENGSNTDEDNSHFGDVSRRKGRQLATDPTTSQITPSLLTNFAALVKEDDIGFLCDQNISFPAHLRHSNPSYLFSFGGSGSTITRILLEHITKVWTGSIYNDWNLLKDGFKGEIEACARSEDPNESPQVLLQKAHPEHLQSLLKDPSLIYDECLGLDPDQFDIPSQQKRNCNAFGTRDDLHRLNVSAVFLVRDPWRAIFSLYQYKFGDEPLTNWHIRHKMQDTFHPLHFVTQIKAMLRNWIKTFQMMEIFDQMGLSYVTVKYENLINLNNTQVAEREISKVLKYLYSDSYYEEMKDLWLERIRCVVADSLTSDRGRFGLNHRKQMNVSQHVTFEMAYQPLIGGKFPLGCHLWNTIQGVASRYQYGNIPGLDCVQSRK